MYIDSGEVGQNFLFQICLQQKRQYGIILYTLGHKY